MFPTTRRLKARCGGLFGADRAVPISSPEGRIDGMQPAEPILVKRYAASRLYDTSKARYVSLGELRAWKAHGIPSEVREAETGEEVSHVLLE
jgi:hypothetical protein